MFNSCTVLYPGTPESQTSTLETSNLAHLFAFHFTTLSLVKTKYIAPKGRMAWELCIGKDFVGSFNGTI
jgi:hypothetical protein